MLPWHAADDCSWPVAVLLCMHGFHIIFTWHLANSVSAAKRDGSLRRQAIFAAFAMAFCYTDTEDHADISTLHIGAALMQQLAATRWMSMCHPGKLMFCFDCQNYLYILFCACLAILTHDIFRLHTKALTNEWQILPLDSCRVVVHCDLICTFHAKPAWSSHTGKILSECFPPFQEGWWLGPSSLMSNMEWDFWNGWPRRLCCAWKGCSSCSSWWLSVICTYCFSHAMMAVLHCFCKCRYVVQLGWSWSGQGCTRFPKYSNVSCIWFTM